MWLKTLLSGKPHFVIGGAERPYMLRWWIIPRNRWFNVYLHKFCRDDDDRALHDHPFAFVSIMLRGQYDEWVDSPPEDNFGLMNIVKRIRRRAPSVAFRRATHRHRVELPKRRDGSCVPCWTLVITGPRVREWGFHCAKGFVPWHQFVNRNDPGAIGPGCGD